MRSYLLLLLVLIGVIGFVAAMTQPEDSYWRHDDRSKLLKFSHTFHVKEQGIACEDCHVTAKASKLSSDNLLGDHASCQSCHDEQISSNCTFCHTSQEGIVPIATPERELIFSHEAHTATLNINCESCHQGLGEVKYASKENMPSMVSCVTCHSKEQKSTQCESCHRNFTSLTPTDHLVGDYRKEHKNLTRVGMIDVSCATCHTSENFCQDCHTGTELSGYGFKRNLVTEPSPKTSVRDTPKKLRLQQVHTLNYRFTHGIDAKSKLLDCSSCHEQQTFCADCHQAGGNITQIKIKPLTHTKSGFATIGKGSGGGLHAELARRDLETCVSCHDVQGNDPTCMLCHTETGTVR